MPKHTSWLVEKLRAGTTFESFWRDVRYSARVLTRSPGFVAAAVVSLGLGIGATTAFYQLLTSLAARSLPVTNPDELIDIRVIDEARARSGLQTGRNRQVSLPMWEQLRDRRSTIGHRVAALAAFGDASFNLAPRGEIRNVEGLWVSGNLFPMLGIQAQVGRLFTEADDVKGCGYAGTVISHAFWQREFGGRPDVLGQRLDINAERVPIIGVTPPGFFGVEVGRSFDVALPLCAAASERRDHFWLGLLGRVVPGTSIEQANAALQAIAPAMLRETVPTAYRPEHVQRFLAMTLDARDGHAGVSPLRRTYADRLWLLLLLSAAVLLVASINLANLMLARATTREREFAVRLAIGGSRARIMRQVLIESVELAALGALLGIGFAFGLTRGLLSMISSTGNRLYLDLSVDWRVISFTAAVAGASCLAFGLAPAIRATRMTSLAPIGPRATAGAGAAHVRRLLVVLQVGLSAVLVFGALMFARSFRNLTTLDPGFRSRQVIFAHVSVPVVAGQDAEARQAQLAAIYRAMEERLPAIAGVKAFGYASSPPLSGQFADMRVKVGTESKGIANLNLIGPGYLDVVQTPLIAGRHFDQRDTPAAHRVAIVSETLARRLFGNAPPLGRFFARQANAGEQDTPIEVVGVMPDSKYYNLREETTAVMFLPFSQVPMLWDARSYAVQTTRSMRDTGDDIARLLAEISPSASVRFANFDTMVHESLGRDHLMATLSGLFGAIALVLAIVGVYGVLAFGVAQRRMEIGLRLALGATRGRIARMVLRETTMLLVAGLGVGLIAALLAGRLARTMLFGLEPDDPSTLLLAAAAMTIAGLAATAVPCLRAASLSPAITLRDG
jgi:putative ABC transport system permease protein